MSRRRRRNDRGRRPSRNDQRRRRRRDGSAGNGDARSDASAFWGDASELPTAPPEVRVTDDPAAVPRSLGEPPLPGHREVAEHYFAAIYDRAVATAGALAAAGGLIDPEELGRGADEDDDDVDA